MAMSTMGHDSKMTPMIGSDAGARKGGYIGSDGFRGLWTALVRLGFDVLDH